LSLTRVSTVKRETKKQYPTSKKKETFWVKQVSN